MYFMEHIDERINWRVCGVARTQKTHPHGGWVLLRCSSYVVQSCITTASTAWLAACSSRWTSARVLLLVASATTG